MLPPSFSNLGEQVRELFDKGYHFGLWKIDINTKTPYKIDFSTSGYSNQNDGEVFGSFQTRYSMRDYGLTVTQRWSTDNTFVSEVAVQDQLLQGLELSLRGRFTPETGNKEGIITMGYGKENVRVDFDFNIDFDGLLINASAVTGYEGFVAGYGTAFDTQNHVITANHFAIGYTYKDCVLHAAVSDGQEFCGSIFQKVSDGMDCGIQLIWTRESNDFHCGVGAAYALSDEASVRVKVNNEIQIGLGYQHSIRKGITLSLSTLIDVKKFSFGEQKIGCALELQG